MQNNDNINQNEIQTPSQNDEHMQIPQASCDTSKGKANTSTHNTNVTSVNTEQKAENSAMNVPSQHTTDMVILHNAFTDALSSMNPKLLFYNFKLTFQSRLKTHLNL